LLNLTGNQETFSKQVPKNLLANILYFLVNVIIGLFLVPFFIDSLGVASYALVPLATSLTGYVNLVHFTTAALLAMIFLVLWIMALIVFSNNKISYSAAGEAFFSSLYIVFAFTGIVWLRDLDNGYIYLLIFIGAWVTDTFAYLTGVTIGRHKLIPVISPKKTVEGSIGGTLFATAAFAVTSYFIGIWSVGWIVIIIGGLLVSVIAQIGDLCMSAIKRQHGIKDFGNLFPGHGGVLDRFDSILAVSSVMTLLFAAINIFSK
jgi:phosphatidate cytidylyltransferase